MMAARGAFCWSLFNRLGWTKAVVVSIASMNKTSEAVVSQIGWRRKVLILSHQSQPIVLVFRNFLWFMITVWNEHVYWRILLRLLNLMRYWKKWINLISHVSYLDDRKAKSVPLPSAFPKSYPCPIWSSYSATSSLLLPPMSSALADEHVRPGFRAQLQRLVCSLLRCSFKLNPVSLYDFNFNFNFQIHVDTNVLFSQYRFTNGFVRKSNN